MAKRPLVIVILVCAIFLTACGGDQPEIIVPTRGRWIDDVYVSEYLGIEFALPAGWNSRSGFGVFEVSENDSIRDWEEPPLSVFRGSDGFRDMMARLYDTNIRTISNEVSIFLRELNDEYSSLSEIEILENMMFITGSRRYADWGGVNPERTPLGGYEWYSIDGRFTRSGEFLREFEVRRLVNIHGGYLRSIFIFTRVELLLDEDFELLTLDEILGHFRDLPHEDE